ncbi:helix-turn-helix domain-containing protein [Ilyomonas limi]|uniref:Helix-turn-helix domain-containing protein n=1 Tax=Ilyomonas limi TaxID=2575867 RepID=A0A4U3L9Y6_9BACT|nr:AraC family transcriptional regulator [Ilyomonas limi]TKK71912.1 helix-turn-helix domain-containing protein [Ilyomonas limi]
MKPFIEKLPPGEDASFVSRIHRTPHFEVPWHQHIEYELILFLEGAGLSFIGNSVDEFEVGDIFFIGSNVPHTFQKSGDLITSAVVIQFKDNFWGNGMLEIPESSRINNLLHNSKHGLKVTGQTKVRLRPIVMELQESKGFWRIVKLCECLAMLADTDDYKPVSTQEIKVMNHSDKERIERIVQYTMDNFKEDIRLETIAAVACMSPHAFCSYFKKRTRKTYVDFLNEIRIGYACKLLLTTEMNILSICFDSGFNNVANFNRQFLKVKQQKPSVYRREHARSML